MTLQRREREKQARELEIITAAEKLFVENGFESTSMDRVASMAEFTKRTVYQYFNSKEDLFYAVVLKGIRQLMAYVDEAIEKGKTGFERIQLVRKASYKFAREFPDTFRLMNYAQFIKTNSENSPNFTEMAKLNSRLFTRFSQVIEEGIKDGSIRSDFKAPVGIFSHFFITTGFLSRLSEAGSTYSARYGISTEELAEYTFSLLDDMMR